MNRDLNTNKLNYIIYARKSSESEDSQVQSLETQLRELNEHAERNQLNVVKVITESKSAFKIGREGFNEMCSLIKKGKANAILVIRGNRISRNPIDAGYVISLMDEKKLLFIRTPNSTCYTSSSTDKMMIALELIFSKKDSDDKGDMVKEGQKSKALKGYPHGLASLGFLNYKTEDKGNRKWIIDPDRFWKIQKIFEMFLTGNYSAGQVYNYAMGDLKLTTVSRKRSGGALIAPSRIYEILRDPIYSGFFTYGGQRYELNNDLPRVINEKEYERVDRLLSKRNIPKTQQHQSIYSGYLKSEEGDFVGQDVKCQLICQCKNKFAYRDKTHCPRCGTEIEEIIGPKYLIYTYYYNVRKKKFKLPYVAINEKEINSSLKEYVNKNLSFSNDLIEWSRKHITELKDKEINDAMYKKNDLISRKEEFESKKSRLRMMLRDMKITDPEYDDDLQKLKDKYKDLNEIKESKKDWYHEMMEITDLVSKVAEVMEKGEFEPVRSMLSKLGSNLVWNEEKLNVYNKKSIERLVDGVKGIRSKYPKFEPKNYVINKGSKEKTPLENEVFSTMLLR